MINKNITIMNNLKKRLLKSWPLMLAAVCLCGCSGKKENRLNVDYIAVQFEEKQNWSIIDASGKVVASEEYPADNRISEIFNDVYWVKSSEGYQLYNISDPKKPVTDDVYDNATGFCQGRAAVSRSGEQIRIVSESGETVCTLGPEIRRVWHFSNNGLAVFLDGKTGKYGYINRDGKIKIKPTFDGATMFCDGHAIAVDTTGGKIRKLIIDTDGNTTGQMSDEYSAVSAFFNEGLLPVIQEDTKDKHLEFMNQEGKIELTLAKSEFSTRINSTNHAIGILSGAHNFLDGYVTFRNKDDKYGVANKEGETVIRPKYNLMVNLGKERFRAERSGKWGIVDAEDNTIVPFEYDNIANIRLGGNYLVKSGDLIRAVNDEGKKAFNDEFSNVSIYGCDEYAEFTDIKGMSKVLAGLFLKTGYNGMPFGTKVSSVAKSLNVASPEKYKNSLCLNGDMTLNNYPEVKPEIEFYFNNQPVETVSHQEKVNDGWWTYNKTVIDGYRYTNGILTMVKAKVSLWGTGYPADKVYETVCKMIEKQGFTYNADNSGEHYATYQAVADGCNSANSQENKVSVQIAKNMDNIEIEYYYPTAILTGNYNPGGKAAEKQAGKAAEPAQPSNAGDATDSYAYLSTSELDEEAIMGNTPEENRILRNAIYARHGYKFKDKKLAAHFSQYSWYKPVEGDVLSKLNEIEKKNIAFLKAHE